MSSARHGKWLRPMQAAGFRYALMLIMLPVTAAAACDAPVLGEGRVANVADVRSFTLADGREVRLAGIDAPAKNSSANERGRAALSAMISGKVVTLRGSKPPDRYGRLVGYAFESSAQESFQLSIQSQLVAQGLALASINVVEAGCSDDLKISERTAREAKKGLWASSTAIKSAEKPEDILAEVGQYVVVEGRTLSVRQAGGTVYVNFGRRWTRDFAVTISRRRMAAFEAAGFGAKALENRRIRVTRPAAMGPSGRASKRWHRIRSNL